LLLAGLLTFPALVSCDPKRVPRSTGWQAATLYSLLLACASDDDGRFPPDLQTLYGRSLLPKAKLDVLLAGVIEYRGAGLRVTDDPGRLLLRYKCEGGQVAQVMVSGRETVVSGPPPQR